MMGGVRGVAQVISYELPLTLLLMTAAAVNGALSLTSFFNSPILLWAVELPLVLMLFIVLLAETNRAPFDLPEAEAELVAGYNLEYSSILFSFFFLAEYNNIIIACYFLSILFFNGVSILATLFFMTLFVLVRAVLPRYTFAQLMSLCWKSLLPLAMGYFAFVVLVVGGAKFYLSAGIRAGESEMVSGFFYVGHTFFHQLLIFFLAALFLAFALLLINRLLAGAVSSSSKSLPYECGFESYGAAEVNFEPNFLAVALMFLVYDVDILLLFP